MKTFIFTYILVGKGETESDALDDALGAFVCDPGEPTEVEEELDYE